MSKRYNFEKKIIDPILNTIKKHQTYLTLPENLPQLAKLGYMYNTLWYAGRVCWGYHGRLNPSGRGYVCEENPKYKLEMCEPKTEDADLLIYDAWAMHVSNDIGQVTWKQFSNIVNGDHLYSEWDIKARKPNKTLEEWVDVLSNKSYTYYDLYPDKKAVVDHLLFVIGNGYGYNKETGFVFEEAGGADQDEDVYGFWEIAAFRSDIQKVVDKIMADPDVQKTIEEAHLNYQEYKQKEADKRAEEAKRWEDLLLKTEVFSKVEPENEKTEELKDELKGLIERLKTGKWISKKEIEPHEIPYRTYYPICNYSIITMFDENTHPSYIAAGIEACEEILAHEDEETNRSHGKVEENVRFAKEFLTKFKKVEEVIYE